MGVVSSSGCDDLAVVGGQWHTGLLEVEWVTGLPRAQKVNIVIYRVVVVRLMQVMESDTKHEVCPVTFV